MGGAHSSLQPLEVNSRRLLKLSPLCFWNFHTVEGHAVTHNIPVNALLAQDDCSIGDWHSTEKFKEGKSERYRHWYGREKKTATAAAAATMTAVATSSNAGWQ